MLPTNQNDSPATASMDSATASNKTAPGNSTATVSTTMPVAFSPVTRVETNAGTFLASSSTPMVSSARKQVFRGTLLRDEKTRVPAVAILFLERDPAYYAAEVSALARNQILCVGPTPYDLAARVMLENDLVPLIIEEDAGTNLEHALFEHAVIRGSEPSLSRPLSLEGTDLRARENQKIMYDILDQVERLHAHGLYHRDIRAANICVRRFGEQPEDLHATLIDHELVTGYEGTSIPASAERYRKALFCDIPQRLDADTPEIRPTSLMRDLGYLAALRYELATGRSIETASPRELVMGVRPFFQYTAHGVPIIRRLDRSQDIDPIARMLKLTPLDTSHFFDERVRAFVKEHIAPSGYLDKRACQITQRETEILDDAPVNQLARDAAYRMWADACRRAGRVPEYDGFEDQPEQLQVSNINQIRDIPSKMRALGYRMVKHEQAPEAQRIVSFSTEEIEYLAFLEHRRWCDERIQGGWVLGSPRDDERRIHPNLIPYDALSETDKEYNRVAARGIIEILNSMGYAVVRDS